MDALFFQIVLVLIASVVAQWTAWKLHIPAILFLLGLGFFLGPVTGVLDPKLLLGDLLGPAVSAAVAIILFEGALHLRFSELREAQRAVRHIILIGGPLGWYLITWAAHNIGGLEMPVAAVLGGMLVVTGPTVIMPMLRQARLNPRAGNILKWEGIVNDPIGVIFAVLAFEYFVAAEHTTIDTMFYVSHGVILTVVTAAGFGMAHLIKYLFEHGYMPEYLKAPFILTIVLALFLLSNSMLHESGLIAVTVLGMTLANIHTASLEEIHKFKETITLLLVSGVFILLTASLDASALLEINWRSLLFIVALLFIIRPLTVAVCSLGTKISWRETLLIGWIAPRGVVCAAMAGVLGPSLVAAGFEDGAKLIPIAFAVVLITVIAHSLTIGPLARRLELQTKEKGGLIITGAHGWGLQLAEVLQKRDIPVLLVDNKFSALKEARMHGVPTYYGELLSEEIDYALEFVKYDTLIAATYSPAYNALVCDKYGYEFGRERVFTVPPGDEDKSDRIKIANDIRGRRWTKEQFTIEQLNRLFAGGWRFRTRRVGLKEGTDELIIPEENEQLKIVGVVNKNGVLQLRSENTSLSPKANDTLILMEKDEKKDKE